MTLHGIIIQANCIEAMTDLESGSVDFVLTDPPYLIDYRGRGGRRDQTIRMCGEDIGFCCSALTDPRR
jgi:DNA modification methylase